MSKHINEIDTSFRQLKRDAEIQRAEIQRWQRELEKLHRAMDEAIADRDVYKQEQLCAEIAQIQQLV